MDRRPPDALDETVERRTADRRRGERRQAGDSGRLTVSITVALFGHGTGSLGITRPLPRAFTGDAAVAEVASEPSGLG